MINQQVKAAEDEMGLGQIEEVAEIARDELDLIEVYFGNFFNLL